MFLLVTLIFFCLVKVKKTLQNRVRTILLNIGSKKIVISQNIYN